MLTLKITYISASQNKSTTMRFMQDMSVSEVCKQIREKIGEGGPDHGLFQPMNPGKNPARWLRPERTLQYYDLQANDELYYRKKHRQMKIRLMDDTTKTMLIDDSLTVLEMVDVIAQRIDLKNPEEFSLQCEGREGTWLNPTLSLHENGVPENAVLILKKKFFFSDANIDRSDPVQLHLLYIQCRDAVVSGKLPVTKDEATTLAALQCQIQYGNYDPMKHKPGWLPLNEFLAPQHLKIPEKNIYAEQKKLVGMSEVNAKFRYVQLCRSLKTYGITSYEVKEKKKNTRKWIPVLIGVTRDAILKMDAETKEVIKQWPLTHLRRWAASDKTFTLDFGDYEEDYMTFQTTEGEAISQLIAGYIDIILKKKKDMGRVEREDDSIVPVEEMIAPIMAAPVMSITSTIGMGGTESSQGREAVIMDGRHVAGMQGIHPQAIGGKGVQNTTNKQGVSGSGQPINDLGSALEACNLLIQDLQNPGTAILAPGDKTPEEWRKQLAAHANAVAKSASELLTSANKKDIERSVLDGIAKQLGLNIQQMVNAARHAATGSEEDISLLQGAKAVSEAVAEILKCAKAVADSPNNEGARAAMSHAAEALKAAQNFLAAAMQGTLITDKVVQDLILESAKAVAAAASEMCTSAYDAARTISNPQEKSALVNTGKGTAAATNSLVSIAQAVAPGMASPAVRSHFAELSRALESQCATLSGLFNRSVTDPSLLDRMASASKDLADAIAHLISAMDTASMSEPNPKDFTPAATAIASHVAQLLSANGNPQTIRINTSGIQDQTGKIINASKMLLPVLPSDLQKRLLATAKSLTDATAKLVPISKEAIAKPKDPDAQFNLKGAATEVGESAQELLHDGGKVAAMMTLRHVAKRAAADTTGLVATSRGAMNSINPADQGTKMALKKSCHDVSEVLARLLDAVKRAAAKPLDSVVQNELLETAKTAAISALSTVSVSKRAALKVMDPAQKAALLKAANQASQACQDLLNACKVVDEIGQIPEVTQALEQLSSVDAELDSMGALADAGYLQNTSNITHEEAIENLTAAAREFEVSNADVCHKAKNDPDKTGAAVNTHISNVSAVVQAAQDVASTSPDKFQQKKVINAAKGVTRTAGEVLALASKVAQAPEDRLLSAQLDEAQRKSQQAVSDLLSAALGINPNELDETAGQLEKEIQRLQLGPVPPGNYQDYVEHLTQATRALSAAVSSVTAAARMNPKGIPAASRMACATVPPFVDVANLVASANKDKKAGNMILHEARAVTNETANLLSLAKAAAMRGATNDPAIPASEKLINDAINRLLNIASPGKREINEALQIMMDAMNRLIDPSAVGAGGTLDDLQKNTKRLAEAVQSINANARSGQPERLGESVKQATQFVSKIVDASKAICAGTDSNDISGPVHEILKESRALKASHESPAQIVNSVKNIATQAAALAATAKRLASSNEISQDAKANLIRATQALAAGTASFAKTAKGTALQLLASLSRVEDLAQAVLAAAPVSRSGAITRELADKLTNATRGVADSTTVVINASSACAAKPGDPAAQAQLSSASANLTEAITALMGVSTLLLPGVKECERAADLITAGLSDIDSALLQVAVGSFNHAAPAGKTYPECQEDIISASRDFANSIQKIVQARNSPQELAQAAEMIGSNMPRLIAAVKNAVATTTNQKRQIDLLKVTKDLATSMLALVNTAKHVGAAPQDAKKQQEFIGASTGASQAIQKMVGFLKNEAISYRELDEAIQVVVQAMQELDQPLPSPEGRNYSNIKADVSKFSKDLALSISNLCNAAKANIDNVGAAGKSVAAFIPRMISQVRFAAAITEDMAAKAELPNIARELAQIIKGIMESAKVLTTDQKNAVVVNKISSQYQAASTTITALLSALKRGAKGERDTETAIDEIGQIIGDLDAAALFAAANQLEVELPPGTTYQASERALIESARQLGRGAGNVISGAQANMELLGRAAREMSAVMAQIAKRAKETAFQIPDMVAQQDLLTMAKGVAIAAQQFIAAGQYAHDHRDDASAQADLQEGAQKVAASVDRLIKQTEAASAEAAKGVKMLEQAQREIMESVKRFESTQPPRLEQPTNQDIIAAARAISAANAHMITAINASQDDIAAAAKEAAEAAEQILDTTKAAFKLTDKPSVREKLKQTVKATTMATAKLLEAAKLNNKAGQKTDAQQQISAVSQEVAERINDYVAAARELPGASKLSLVEDFGEDLDEIAEKELRNAAAVIERAAASILSSRPRNEGVVDINYDDLDITEAILEAARAIALATSTLVKAAAAAQRERVLAGRDPKTKHLYKKDPAWANGLISAAKVVAASTQHLVTTANNAAQHKEGGDEEHLVACAKAVAAATAQLVAASKAKADPLSVTQKTLSDAAKSVANATSQLVNAAKVAAQREEEAKREAELSKKSDLHQAKIQEIELQAQILKLEKQLSEARNKLHQMRKDQYANAGKI